MYPNITVEIETDTNYSDDSILRLQSGDWGDIMMIPAVDKVDLSTYFFIWTLDEMSKQIRFAIHGIMTDWFTAYLLPEMHRALFTIRECLRKQA